MNLLKYVPRAMKILVLAISLILMLTSPISMLSQHVIDGENKDLGTKIIFQRPSDDDAIVETEIYKNHKDMNVLELAACFDDLANDAQKQYDIIEKAQLSQSDANMTGMEVISLKICALLLRFIFIMTLLALVVEITFLVMTSLNKKCEIKFLKEFFSTFLFSLLLVWVVTLAAWFFGTGYLTENFGSSSIVRRFVFEGANFAIWGLILPIVCGAIGGIAKAYVEAKEELAAESNNGNDTN